MAMEIFEFRHDSFKLLYREKWVKNPITVTVLLPMLKVISGFGHRLALSKINTDTRKIMTYGPEIGITGDCNPASAGIDPSGNLRFGTTDGLIQYNYQKNRQKLLPPTLNLISVKISDKEN